MSNAAGSRTDAKKEKTVRLLLQCHSSMTQDKSEENQEAEVEAGAASNMAAALSGTGLHSREHLVAMF